jgi:hypothetical protein
LYLCTDSLIAFKGVICYSFGAFCLIIAKISQESVRPFWLNGTVDSEEGFCTFDFASPSIEIFGCVFYGTYNIYMYFVKYTKEDINLKLIYSLLTLLCVYTCIVIEGLNSFGLVFYYQSFLSCIFAACFFLICINYDTFIDKNSEKVGFSVRSSRKYKFYLLFINVILYTVGKLWTITYDQLVNYNKNLWIINSSTNELKCREQLYGAKDYKDLLKFSEDPGRIGIEETYYNSQILNYLVSMGFGCSFSLVNVDSIDWIKTRTWKRLVRTIIGFAFYMLMFYLIEFTKFFLRRE